VISFMISSVLFFSDVHFIFRLHTSVKLLPEIVQCCPPQSEVIWWLESDAVSSVTSVHTVLCSLCQWLLLFLSVTFTVNCQNKCLFWFILLLCCCFVTVNST
jgi:hypothetical protein